MVAKFHTTGRDHSALWQVFAKMHDASTQLCQLEVMIGRDQNNLAYEVVRFAVRSRECQFFYCFPECVVSFLRYHFRQKSRREIGIKKSFQEVGPSEIHMN